MVRRISPLLGAKEELTRREESMLSPYAALSTTAVRRRSEERVERGHRQHFSLDADRILHSLAYTRRFFI
jgi:dGTPase